MHSRLIRIILLAAPVFLLAGHAESQVLGREAPIALAIQPDSGRTFVPGGGHEFVIREGGGWGTSASYAGLLLPACEEGPCAGLDPESPRALKCQLENGFDYRASVGECLPQRPGSVSGAVRAAVQMRFALDTDQRQDICWAEYQGNGERVMIVPVTRPEVGPNGRCHRLIGFTQLFLRRMPGAGNQASLAVEAAGPLVTYAGRRSWGDLKRGYYQ